MDSWEARMAARRVQRAERLDAAGVAESRTTISTAQQERARARDLAEDRRWLAGMTLGAAQEELSRGEWACACCGPPRCCMDRWRQAEAVVHAARVAAKQVSDLIARRLERQLGNEGGGG